MIRPRSLTGIGRFYRFPLRMRPLALAAFVRICIRSRRVLPPHLPELRGSRGDRLRIRRGGLRPAVRSRPDQRQLNTYNYFRRNVAGVQREWWYHRSGCRVWFLAERDTRTNEVQWTALPSEAPARAIRRRRRRPPPAGRGSRRREPAARPARRADRPQPAHLLHVRRQDDPRVRGRHDRLRAVRQRAPHVQPLVQVPPPARRAVRLRPVRELARADRRPPRRARLRRAGRSTGSRSSTPTRSPGWTST